MAAMADAQRSEDTRLNSSHTVISYAVFCLKKKTSSRSALCTSPRGKKATKRACLIPARFGVTRRLRITAVVFFNRPATTEIYTLSLHDALPICPNPATAESMVFQLVLMESYWLVNATADRKSTRLNSSHTVISYAVFCLKK